MNLFIILFESHLTAVIEGRTKNLAHILMGKSAGVGIEDRVRRIAPVKTKGQRSVLHIITKRELHLVAILEFQRASEDSVIYSIVHHLIQQAPDHVLLHGQLILIRHGLTEAAAAQRKIVADPLSGLKRRLLNNLKEPALDPVLMLFEYPTADSLSGQRILYRQFLTFLGLISSAVRIIHSLDHALRNVFSL